MPSLVLLKAVPFLQRLYGHISSFILSLNALSQTVLSKVFDTFNFRHNHSLSLTLPS